MKKTSSIQNVKNLDKKTAVLVLSIILATASLAVNVLSNRGVLTPEEASMVQRLMADMDLSYEQVVDALNVEVGSSLSTLMKSNGYVISHPLGDTAITAMNNGTTGSWVYWSTSAAAVINATIGNMTGGMSCCFKAGTYLVTTNLTVITTDRLKFSGEGASSILRLAANDTNIFVINANDTQFENLAFDGNKAEANAMTTPHNMLHAFWQLLHFFPLQNYLFTDASESFS